MSFLSEWRESFRKCWKKFKGSWPAKFTVIWLLLVVASSVMNWHAFCEMAPNEWGDFLAGTISPIAFMWLVFGYIQQGRELKQNTEALVLQRRELKQLVEANNKIAVHAEQQAKSSSDMAAISVEESKIKRYEALESMQPKFVFEFAIETADEQLMFWITNKGKVAYEAEMSSVSCSDVNCTFNDEFCRDEKVEAFFRNFSAGGSKSHFEVSIHYIDSRGIEMAQSFRIRNKRVYLDSFSSAASLYD